MAPITAEVRFSYRRAGSNSKTTTTTSFQVKQESETLVMQKLEELHKNCDIEIISIKWR